jgi:hypothetical protein
MANSALYITSKISAITHNESHVCDVAPSPTRARGHVVTRRAAAPRNPRRLPRRRSTYVLLCEVPFRTFSDDLADESTRTNQTEPRTGEAICEEESSPGTMNPVCERKSSARSVTGKRQVNQENPRGGSRSPCCGKRRYRRMYAYEPDKTKDRRGNLRRR